MATRRPLGRRTASEAPAAAVHWRAAAAAAAARVRAGGRAGAVPAVAAAAPAASQLNHLFYAQLVLVYLYIVTTSAIPPVAAYFYSDSYSYLLDYAYVCLCLGLEHQLLLQRNTHSLTNSRVCGNLLLQMQNDVT